MATTYPWGVFVVVLVEIKMTDIDVPIPIFTANPINILLTIMIYV